MTDKASNITTRPATRSDIIMFFGELPPQTMRAQVMENDGRLVGIGGYWRIGDEAVVFSDLVKDHGVPALTIYRIAKTYMNELGHDARCVAMDDNSGRFLTSLGWTHIGTADEGEVYEWLC